MAPVEFAVSGIPVSAQAKNLVAKRAYQSEVMKSSKSRMGRRNMFDGPVRVEIMIYTEGGLGPDCDNVAKPVLDAMEGIVFLNDRQVAELVVRRQALDEFFRAADLSPLQFRMLRQGNPFMYVKVTAMVDRSVSR